MKRFWEFIDGYKCKIVAIGVAAAGILQAFEVPIPEVVWILLSAAGLGAIRSAIKKAEK